jgi:hypothetical protein
MTIMRGEESSWHALRAAGTFTAERFLCGPAHGLQPMELTISHVWLRGRSPGSANEETDGDT